MSEHDNYVGDLMNPNKPQRFIADNRNARYGAGRMGEGYRSVLKTESKELALSMHHYGFKIVGTTDNYVIYKDKLGLTQKKSVPVEYTLWGPERRLTNQHYKAIADGVLWKIGAQPRKSVTD